MKNRSFALLLIVILIVGFVFVSNLQFGKAQIWQIENGGGQYSSNHGGFDLSGKGGTYVIVYEQIAPTADFNFSISVNAATLGGFAVMLRSNLPFVGLTQGVNFEFGARDGGTFSLARYSSNWTWNEFVNNIGENVNYTMILSVTKNPFTVTATVLSQNGTSLGSYSASDMTNLTFANINYIGYGVLESGGNYSVRYVESIALYPTTPTSAPTPTPVPSPTLPTPDLVVSCKSSAFSSNFKVEINGTLTFGELGLSDVPVLLSYSVNEGNSWIGLTTAETDNSGNFFAVWFPSASGTYLLNAIWSGNSTFSDANTTISFAVLPYQAQSVFSMSSNSTVSAFAFNSTSHELSFSVSGPQGTTGYVDINIPKSLISEVSSLKVFLDGNQLIYTAQSQGDSWLLTFNYHHSAHKVIINLGSGYTSSPSFIQSQLGESIIIGAAIAIIAIVAVLLVIFRSKKTKTSLQKMLR